MSFPIPATTIYGVWTQAAEGNADIETRLTQRGVNVRDFPYNAKGDGVTNDSPAFALALAAAAGKTLLIPPANPGQFYKLTGSLLPASKTVIEGCGLAGELRQLTAETTMFNLSTASDVTFLNVALFGQGGYSNAWVDDAHFDIGISAAGGSGLRVINCIIRNFALAGVFTSNTSDVLVMGNKVQGTHQFGATINVGSAHQYGIAITDSVPTSGVRITENDVSDSAFGINTSGAPNLLSCLIGNNNVHDTRGQHGMYMGSTRAVVCNNVVTEFVNHGIKLFAGTIATQREIVCTGNHISSTVSNGFGIVCAANATGIMTDVVIADNQIRNRSGTPTVNGLAGGILVQGALNVMVSRNLIRDVYTNAISVDNTQVMTDIVIDGNLIIAPATNGINIAAPAGSARIRITGNNLSNIPGPSLGINLASAVDDVFIEGNTIIGGFNSITNVGVCTNLRIVNNVLTGWGSEPFPLSANAVLYENNQDGKEFTTYAATSGIVDYDRYIGVNCVAAVTMTVPSAASRRGKSLTFIKTDASGNAATISCPSTLINGAVTTVLAAQFNKVTIRSNGVTWFIV